MVRGCGMSNAARVFASRHVPAMANSEAARGRNERRGVVSDPPLSELGRRAGRIGGGGRAARPARLIHPPPIARATQENIAFHTVKS